MPRLFYKITAMPISLVLVSLLTVTSLGGCGDKDTPKTDNAVAASAAEAAPPMTAAPADNKGTPVLINETNSTVDAGGDINTSVATSVAMPASGTASSTTANETGVSEDGADNSGMEKISENDQVIDDQPASPNAPRASDEGTGVTHEHKAVGNAKVGK